jgi:tight adherence protein C
LVRPFQKVLPRNPADVSSVQRKLVRAGYREQSYVNIFYSSKVLVPAAFCLVATVTQVYAYSPLFVYAVAAGVGFLAPDFWLNNRVSARKMKLQLGLPEALDLMVICVEAGLSVDKATMRTAEELQISQPAIADEMTLVYLEQRAGRPRAEAWRNFGERTDVDTIRSLASILIQADKFGTSVGKTLRTHSEALRTRRRQDAEEQAAKTTVKLTFPLVLFIFPSLFVVTLGPSMIIMLEGFQQFLG